MNKDKKYNKEDFEKELEIIEAFEKELEEYEYEDNGCPGDCNFAYGPMCVTCGHMD